MLNEVVPFLTAYLQVTDFTRFKVDSGICDAEPTSRGGFGFCSLRGTTLAASKPASDITNKRVNTLIWSIEPGRNQS